MAIPFKHGLNRDENLSGFRVMNILLRLLTVGSVLTAASTFAATAFEGKVTLAMTGEKGPPQAIDYAMKGQKLRMDIKAAKTEPAGESDQPVANEPPKKSRKMIPGFLGGKPNSAGEPAKPGRKHGGGGEQITTIMDMEKMEMLMLMPSEKMYMVMPIKKAVDKAIEHAEKSGAANTEVERTGKTEKILGYSCDQILVKDKEKGTVTEMWVASDLGMFGGLGGGGGGGMFGGGKSAAAAKWEEVLKGKGGFPLRVITHDAKGKETFKMETTKIEPGPQPDSLFAPPADYEKFSMPDLGSLNPFKQG